MSSGSGGLRVVLACHLLACSSTATPPSAVPGPQPPAPAAPTPALPAEKATPHCPVFKAKESGRNTDPALTEVSGIAASTTLPAALWAHNDSGDRPRLFALGRDGVVHGEVALTGANAIDWEDMAAAPGAEGLRDLVIGDVGDNLRQRSALQLYRVAEPQLTDLGGRVAARALQVTLPNGPEDIEALFVDPRDGTIYLVAKRLMGSAPLYRIAASAFDAQATHAEHVADVRVRLVTAADMSSDGRRLVLRNYEAAYLWEIAPDETVAAALQRAPCPLPLPREPQGEAIAFADPHTLLLLSEQAQQPVYVLHEQRTDRASTP